MTITNPKVRESSSYLEERPIHIECGDLQLSASFGEVEAPLAVVLIANETGSARHRVCELEVARLLRRERIATLMVDVVTIDEQSDAERAAFVRLDAHMLGHRIGAAREWIESQPRLRGLPVGLLGEGGAGAAGLVEVAARPAWFAAIALRGAEPLHAGPAIDQCHLPTLLVAEVSDGYLVAQNKKALERMHGDACLISLAGATPRSVAQERPAQISALLSQWLTEHLLHPLTAASSHAGHCGSRPCAELDH